MTLKENKILQNLEKVIKLTQNQECFNSTNKTYNSQDIYKKTQKSLPYDGIKLALN